MWGKSPSVIRSQEKIGALAPNDHRLYLNSFHEGAKFVISAMHVNQVSILLSMIVMRTELPVRLNTSSGKPSSQSGKLEIWNALCPRKYRTKSTTSIILILSGASLMRKSSVIPQ